MCISFKMVSKYLIFLSLAANHDIRFMNDKQTNKEKQKQLFRRRLVDFQVEGNSVSNTFVRRIFVI